MAYGKKHDPNTERSEVVFSEKNNVFLGVVVNNFANPLFHYLEEAWDKAFEDYMSLDSDPVKTKRAAQALYCLDEIFENMRMNNHLDSRLQEKLQFYKDRFMNLIGNDLSPELWEEYIHQPSQKAEEEGWND